VQVSVPRSIRISSPAAPVVPPATPLTSKGFCVVTVFDTIKHFVISPESYTTDTAPSYCCWALLFRGNLNPEADNRDFFYKYTPLPNLIVENDPRRKILPFLAWRERLKVTRGSFRHWQRRK
jgi:hypothetical protein